MSCNNWETLSVNPAVNGYIFSNLRRVRQEKETTDGLHLSFAVPRYSGALTLTSPLAIRLWDTFYLLVKYQSSKGVILGI